MDIINELRNFAEENKKEMSVNVYNGIWNIIQSLEHDLKEAEAEQRDRESLEEYDYG